MLAYRGAAEKEEELRVPAAVGGVARERLRVGSEVSEKQLAEVDASDRERKARALATAPAATAAHGARAGAVQRLDHCGAAVVCREVE